MIDCLLTRFAVRVRPFIDYLKHLANTRYVYLPLPRKGQSDFLVLAIEYSHIYSHLQMTPLDVFLCKSWIYMFITVLVRKNVGFRKEIDSYKESFHSWLASNVDSNHVSDISTKTVLSCLQVLRRSWTSYSRLTLLWIQREKVIKIHMFPLPLLIDNTQSIK